MQAPDDAGPSSPWRQASAVDVSESALSMVRVPQLHTVLTAVTGIGSTPTATKHTHSFIAALLDIYNSPARPKTLVMQQLIHMVSKAGCHEQPWVQERSLGSSGSATLTAARQLVREGSTGQQLDSSPALRTVPIFAAGRRRTSLGLAGEASGLELPHRYCLQFQEGLGPNASVCISLL